MLNEEIAELGIIHHVSHAILMHKKHKPVNE